MSTLRHNVWLWTQSCTKAVNKEEEGVSSALISDSVSALGVLCWIEKIGLIYHDDIGKRLTSSNKHVNESVYLQYNKADEPRQSSAWKKSAVSLMLPKSLSALVFRLFRAVILSSLAALSAPPSTRWQLCMSWCCTHHSGCHSALLTTSCAAPPLNQLCCVFVRHIRRLVIFVSWLFWQRPADISGLHMHNLQRWPSEWDWSCCSKLVKLRIYISK